MISMNIFEIKQKLNELHNKVAINVEYVIDEYEAYVHDLLYAEKEITKANISYLYRNLTTIEKTQLYDQVSHMLKPQKQYSRYNQFVYLKRYYNQYKEITDAWYEIKMDTIVPLVEKVKQFEEILTTNKCNNKLLEQFVDIKNQVLNLKSLSFELNTMGLQSLENDIRLRPINKSELLQVITVNKDKATQQIIAEAPETLTLDEFTQLIFVERIENDEDGYLFEFIFKRLMSARKNNPILSKKMDEKFDELFSGIPKFNAVVDEYGDIKQMEQVFSKPKLTLV